MGSQREPEDHSVVPQLAADCDLGSLPLSPAEGFLLSRIDGHTPWSLLRELGGMPPADVDRCLRRLAEQGILVLEGAKPEPPASEPCAPEPPARAAGAALAAELEALVDPSLEIPVEAQRAVLAFEQGLARPYHEILGVPADADTKVLRRAYFRLSKEFHPDRYFRRNLGPFAERVERVFRRIAEAYELLSDPSARREMERTRAEEAKADAPAPEAPGSAPRLRRRSTPHAFSLVARIQRERRRKARQFFAAGEEARVREQWVEAAKHLRLAIACDPGNEDYKAPFAEANRQAHELLAARYMKEADSLYQLGQYAESYQRYVEALHHRPFDAEANLRAARLAWRIDDDLKAAKEYAARACEIGPDVPQHRKLLGQVYAAAGLYKNAQREFEQALRLDPGDDEARQELKTMKRMARRTPLGGS